MLGIAVILRLGTAVMRLGNARIHLRFQLDTAGVSAAGTTGILAGWILCAWALRRMNIHFFET